jgi:potassium voltage-gated channel Eag-related subfamily H protein 7
MVVTPNGNFRMGWDLTMMVGLAFVALFTPFQMSFLQDEHDLAYPERWPFFFALDRLIDFLFLADIAVNFRSGWYSESGAMVFEAHTAAKTYIGGWFALDFLSLVPWETLTFFVELESSSALRLPKLLKLVRLFKIMKLVRASRVVYRLEQNLGIKNGIVRLTKFTLGTVVIAHWLACTLQFISTLDFVEDEALECQMAMEGDPLTTNKWRYNLYCGCTCDKSMLYVAALYWSVMTITTIGYGDVTPVNLGEMAFMVIGMMLGAALFSFVVGTCCSLIEGLDKVRRSETKPEAHFKIVSLRPPCCLMSEIL